MGPILFCPPKGGGGAPWPVAGPGRLMAAVCAVGCQLARRWAGMGGQVAMVSLTTAGALPHARSRSCWRVSRAMDPRVSLVGCGGTRQGPRSVSTHHIVQPSNSTGLVVHRAGSMASGSSKVSWFGSAQFSQCPPPASFLWLMVSSVASRRFPLPVSVRRCSHRAVSPGGGTSRRGCFGCLAECERHVWIAGGSACRCRV